MDTKNIEIRINKVLEKVRPHLMKDGGNVEFVRFEELTGVCELRLLGACSTCPLAIMTLRAGIERFLLKSIKEIKRVESVK